MIILDKTFPRFQLLGICLLAGWLTGCSDGEVVPEQPVAGASSTGGGGAAPSTGGAGMGGQVNPGPTAGSGGSLAGSTAGGSPASGASGGGTGGSSGSGGAGGSGGGGSGSGGGPALPPITDYKAKGPFTTTVDEDVGPGEGYTVFRPSTLGENGFMHAPIIFGPGIGQEVTVHTTMLTNFASHGFVVVGTPKLNQGPGGAANLKSMQDGLDWIVQQNTMPGVYQGKLAVNRVVSMGFSVGGTSAVQLGGNAAIATVVSIHGHTATAELHGPMLQTTGTQDTVGMPLQQATYDSSKVQTFLATLTGAPHGYIEQDGGGNERPAILAWLRYFIYADNGAKSFFYGADCTLCKAPWEKPQRKNWPDM
jgi:dienelactone hydrolase